jgi:hypothetical protein
MVQLKFFPLNVYFYSMQFSKLNRNFIAVLFQGIFICYTLFTVFNENHYPVRSKENSKTLFCLNTSSSTVVRVASEQSASSISFIEHFNFEKLWLCAELFQSTELIKNVGLHISSRAFNTFYILTTIHAP